MPKFSTFSLSKLRDCHTLLVVVSKKLIKHIDFTVVCTYRSAVTQEFAFRGGKSKVQFPDSRHNIFPSRAIDIAPYFPDKPHIRWDDRESFAHLVGQFIATARESGILVRGGIDWDMDGIIVPQDPDEFFYDIGHIELLSMSK